MHYLLDRRDVGTVSSHRWMRVHLELGPKCKNKVLIQYEKRHTLSSLGTATVSLIRCMHYDTGLYSNDDGNYTCMHERTLTCLYFVL
jgi:hypothetical protein